MCERAVPFFFALSGPKKVPWPTGNLLAQSETVDDFSAQILALLLARQFKALYIEMGVMQSSKLCNSSSFVVHQLLDVLEKLRCCVSQENLPLELKRFPIKVVPFSALRSRDEIADSVVPRLSQIQNQEAQKPRKRTPSPLTA